MKASWLWSIPAFMLGGLVGSITQYHSDAARVQPPERLYPTIIGIRLGKGMEYESCWLPTTEKQCKVLLIKAINKKARQ